MTTQTDTKAAIVTGSSRGIGRAVALRLARDGFAVTVNYVRGRAQADEVVAEIVAAGGRAIAVQADVSSAEDVEKLFAATREAFGGIDVLVNSAGILEIVPLAETSDELFRRYFAINVQGPFNTLRAAAKQLRDGGRIVNFSTTSVGLKMPGYAVYDGTKAAVEAFTHVFAKELRGRNITVNAVAPGPVGTDLFYAGKSEQLIQQFAKVPPLERLGRPEDIAEVVAFLTGPGGWVNGQVIRANGGSV